MHFLISILPLIAVSSAATHSPPYLRHRRMAAEAQPRLEAKEISPVAREAPRANAAHAEAHQVIRRVVKKRGEQCRARPPASSSVSANAAPSTSDSSTPTSSIENQQAYAPQSSTSTSQWTPPAASTPATNGNGGNGGGIVSGLLSFTDSTCGWCGSSNDAPNGSEDWLNCGVTGSGWTPPHLAIGDMIAADLTTDGVFAPCAPYIDKFNQYGGEFGVHPIMLASFAMQESTCNPGATGGNGEAGIMQIAQINCNNNGGSCWDLDYNIRRGAELFSQMIDHHNGNVLAAIGAYNGWQLGLTVGSATAAKANGQCFAQNNLDYLHQFVNGWMQNKNGYELGQYFNLRGC